MIPIDDSIFKFSSVVPDVDAPLGEVEVLLELFGSQLFFYFLLSINDRTVEHRSVHGPRYIMVLRPFIYLLRCRWRHVQGVDLDETTFAVCVTCFYHVLLA